VSTISVIIPAWNRAHYLRETIDSVLAQTQPAFEIIVVDDGSTDDTPAVLATYGDRIRVLRQRNQGVATARNTGVAAARGDFLCFLDSDDLWHPRKLELQLARFASDPELGLVHCGFETFDDAGTIAVNLNGLEGWVGLEILRFDRDVILVCGSGVMVPRRVAEECGDFDPRLPVSDDWEYCLRIAMRHRIGFVRESLVRYRQHGTGLHHDIPRMETGMWIALEKAFTSTDPEVQALKRHAYGRVHRILAGCYFQSREPRKFVQHMAKSLQLDWRNVAYFAKYPLRVMKRRR
jgi:glycosyltransferase involved in cell wall biosynthesis